MIRNILGVYWGYTAKQPSTVTIPKAGPKPQAGPEPEAYNPSVMPIP